MAQTVHVSEESMARLQERDREWLARKQGRIQSKRREQDERVERERRLGVESKPTVRPPTTTPPTSTINYHHQPPTTTNHQPPPPPPPPTYPISSVRL